MIRSTRGLMIAFALCAVACTKRNPDYCESSAECTNGYECVDHGCEPVPDAAAACPAHPCPVEMPVCQTDGSCALCSDDPQCSSGVCNADGSCEPDAAVIHVSVDGATTGDCGATGSPCSIEYARTKLTTERHTLALAGGDYALTESFHVGTTIPSLVLVGPSTASFTGPDAAPSILVTDESQLEIRGVSFRRGLACEDAGIAFHAVTFSDPLGTTAIPWIASTRCDVVVLDGQLLDSPADAITLSPPASSSGSLRVERTTTLASESVAPATAQLRARTCFTTSSEACDAEAGWTSQTTSSRETAMTRAATSAAPGFRCIPTRAASNTTRLPSTTPTPMHHLGTLAACIAAVRAAVRRRHRIT